MKQLPLNSPAFRYIEKSFREWLDVLGYAPTSVYGMPNNIRELLHELEQQGCTQLTEITIGKIKKHYRKLQTRANQRRGGGLSNAYLNKHLQALQKFTFYLRQTGKLELSPLNIRWNEKEKTKIDVLTVGEVQELYKATYDYYQNTLLEPLNERDRAMLTIIYGCGLRRSEAVNLDVDDINFDSRVLHVKHGKNYKERFVPLNKVNLKYLQDYIYDARPILQDIIGCSASLPLFISKKGKRMQGQSMQMRLHLLIQRTENEKLKEKKVSLHTLRHSIATHLLIAGMKLENISTFLGHSSLESTQIYTHLIEQEL